MDGMESKTHFYILLDSSQYNWLIQLIQVTWLASRKRAQVYLITKNREVKRNSSRSLLWWHRPLQAKLDREEDFFYQTMFSLCTSNSFPFPAFTVLFFWEWERGRKVKLMPSLIFTFNKNIDRGDNTPFAFAYVSAYVSDCCIFGVPLFIIGTPCFCWWVWVLEIPSHGSIFVAPQP